MNLKGVSLLILLNIFLPIIINSQNLGFPIDEPHAIENGPVISIDGNSLIYASNKDGIWKLYESIRENDKWSIPVSINSINQYAKQNDVIRGPFLSYDGNTLYFSANFEGGLGSMDIYFSKKTGDEWTKPENLGWPINSDKYEGSPSISTDDRSLYFEKDEANASTSDADCKSIYVSHKDISGKWGEPQMLPPPINLDCEKSPRICPDNRTLMFCSYREGGLGFFDIYISKHIVDELWTEPKHLYFASTRERDQYPSVSASGDLLYFNLCVVQYDKTSWCSIYKVSLPEEFRIDNNITYKGYIYDKDKNPLKSDIIIKDALTTDLFSKIGSYDDGRYTMVLTKGKKYQVEIIKENYSRYVFYHDARDITKNEIINKDFILHQNVELNLNIYDKVLFFPIDANINVLSASDSILQKLEIVKYEKGKQKLILPIGEKYIIQIQSNYYEDYQFSFEPVTIYYSEFSRDIDLQPILKEFSIEVADIETDEILDEVEIEIVNMVTNESLVKKVKRDENGNFVFNLRDGDDYSINIRGPKGYSFYNSTIDMSENKNNKLEVKLEPLKATTSIVLNNISFELNSADLNSNSFEELNRVVQLLSDNPEIAIIIAAHTDDIGSDKYNYLLSEKRAASVVEYLIEQGVSHNVLRSKGYGESNPLVPNTNDENRALNRRVELKIAEITSTISP